MDFEKWLRKNIGVAVVGLLVAIGIGVWIGVAIYHHDHKTNIASTSPNQQSATTNPGSSTQSNTTGSSSTTSGSGLDANGCYTPSTVRSHEDINGCVDFNVGYAYQDSAGTVFIDQLSDYTSGVEVYIPWNAAASDIDYQALEGKNIKATGYISNYNGAPQVTVTQLSQIQIYQQ